MNDDEPFLTDDEQALHAEVKLMRQEHSDLDAAIDALGHMPIPDQLRIARLKRKKLQLRDEIVKIESRILPDIIA